MNIQGIQNKLLNWYRANAKSFPWREDPTPYHVWISEIMLQQTRIEAALPYYQRFIATLPDIQALANVPQDELLKLWEGLGYYSRAKNLQKAALVIMESFDGQLPADYDQLLSLPGIGAYTAGAIASIAYHIPVPAVDGNVMRVLARLTNDNTDVLSNAGKKHFTQLASELIDREDPGAFNQALMELGENICLPNTTPHCSRCPLQGDCAASAYGTTAALPIRIKKTQRRVEDRQVVVLTCHADTPHVLIHYREDKGLLGGMWEFPNTTNIQPLSCVPNDLSDKCNLVESLSPSKHLFSHIEWRMTGHHYTTDSLIALPDAYHWATLHELEQQYPIPGAFATYKKLLYQLLSEEN